MVFPLPPALSQLADAFCDKDAGSEVSGAVTGGGGQQPSSSSEDERHWSNVMYDRKVGKELTAEKGSHILICNHSRAMLGSQQLYQSATKWFPLSRSADQLWHIDILIKYPCNNLETLEQSPEVP